MEPQRSSQPTAVGNYSHHPLSLLYGVIELTRLFNPIDNVTLYEDKAFYDKFNQVVVPSLFGAIIGIGVIGNAMVILVILRNRKMKTHVNILLMNVAVADLLFLLVCVPFTMYHHMADNWNLGEHLCKVYNYISYVTVYVTMYTLVAVAVARFLLIAFAQRLRALMFPGTVPITIVIIWLLLLGANVPIIFSYQVKRIVTAPGMTPYQYCAMASDVIGQRIFMTFFVFGYLIPLVMVCVFSLMLLRYLRLTSERSSLRQLQQQSSQRSDGNRHPRGQTAGGHHSRHVSSILTAVVVVLAICWLPLHIHLLLVYFNRMPQSRYYWVYRVFAHCLAYANSCMNPFIYSFVSNDFRRNFRRLLPCANHSATNSNNWLNLRDLNIGQVGVTGRDGS